MAHIRKLKSGKWQATVRHPSGQRWSKSDPLKRVVKDWADELESKMRRGEFIDPSAGRMTLTELWEKWQPTRNVSGATTKKHGSQWRAHLKPAFGKWPIATIRPWDIEAWVTEMSKQGVGAETVAASLRLLKQMMRWAVRHKLVVSSPAELVKAPAVPAHKDRILTFEEEDRVLVQLHGSNRVFVELLLDTGLRWGEAAALDGIHFRALRKLIRVERSLAFDGTLKPPKSNAGNRDVPASERLMRDLPGLITSLDEPIFRTPEGKRWRYQNWSQRVWAPAIAAAELEDPQPTPHDCRHSYGSRMADAGTPVHDLAALMGHSDWRMTQRYVHSSEGRFDRAQEVMAEMQRRRAAGERHEP